MKRALSMAAVLSLAPSVLMCLPNVASAQPKATIVGTWLGEFKISSSKDPLASKYDSWKELVRFHNSGRYETTYRFYKDGKVLSEMTALGRWGSDDKKKFWTKWESYIQDGVRHSSSDRSEYVIEQLADGVLRYTSATSGRKFQSKQVKDDFKLP